MREIDIQELRVYLDNAKTPPLLLDVREPWEFAICHLPGSRLIPMRQVPARLGDLDPAQEIVVICHHGIRSRLVALYLEHQGFARIINMRGGIDAWARELDPGMPTY